jgi:hypothetical protein
MLTRKAIRFALLPVAAGALLGTSSGALAAGSWDAGSFKLSYGGYVKLDVLYSDYSDGNPASNSIGRDWYVASTTPVGGDDDDAVLDAHAQQSRFFFATEADVGGKKVTSRFEFDFMVSPGGNERVSNSYNPRMRHAFFTYDKFLFGQTWSTFQNVSALPDTVDFVGASDSTIFVRQAQVRYTTGNFAIALENPETTVSNFATSGRIDADDNNVPDLAARYILKTGFGDFWAAGLVRQLKIQDDAASGIDDDDVGYGISLSGKIPFGDKGSDFRFMGSFGEGMGRYMGLNLFNGAESDASGNIDALESYGAFGALRLVWNSSWRSSFVGSIAEADNSGDIGGATKKAWSISGNVIYSPVPGIDLGLELRYAEREVENGDDGDLTRVQFGARYNL